MRNEKAVEHNHFGEILHVLHANNRKYLNDSFSKHGLTLFQAMCILTIYQKQDMTQKELTEIMCLTKSGITKAINKLQDDKFIIKENSADDKRRFILKLTKKGRDIVPTLISINAEWENKIGFSELDDGFIETLKMLACNSIELNSCGK